MYSALVVILYVGCPRNPFTLLRRISIMLREKLSSFVFRQLSYTGGATIISVILMTIYLDTLVIVNTYISWIMLLITSRIARISAPPIRLAIGAAIGGLSSLLILIKPDNTAVSVAVVFAKLFAVVAASGAVFLKKHMSKKKLAAALVIFAAVNILFGGIIYLAQSLLKTRVIYFSGANYYFDIPLPELIVLTAVVYVAIVITSHFTSHVCDISHSYKVNITVGGRSFSLDGVADTGNTVTELISGRPVVICTGIDYSPQDNKGVYAVPYSTINSDGILYAYMPDSIQIENETGSINEAFALVAFMEKGDKRAVFNPKILC